jgi:hypothetical protein
MLVKCLDNSWYEDVLKVGKLYELEEIAAYDNFRLVGIKGLFHHRRFASLPDVPMGAKEIVTLEPTPEIGDASFPEPIRRYRGREH